MTEFYIGCKQIEAWPESKDGQPGYGVKYPDGYQSWSPREAFEAAYLPMGFTGSHPDPVYPNHSTVSTTNENKITQEMVDDFIAICEVHTVGEKTTVVHATLKNGFEIVESSSCVDAANYSEELGAKICKERIQNQVWHLLGFALQWARTGLR